MTERLFSAINGEDGHAAGLIGPLVGAAGAIILGIGAAKDRGGLDVIGGILLAVGLIAGSLIHHVTMDWEFFRRTEK